MITISEKDADFIAQIAREEIGYCNKRYENFTKDVKGLIDAAGKLKQISLPSEKVDKAYQKLLVEYEKDKNDVETEHQRDIEKWQRVIELMIGGSDE